MLRISKRPVAVTANIACGKSTFVKGKLLNLKTLNFFNHEFSRHGELLLAFPSLAQLYAFLSGQCRPPWSRFRTDKLKEGQERSGQANGDAVFEISSEHNVELKL